MKFVEQHIVKLLSVIAVFLVFGNVAMAANTLDLNNKGQVVSAFQDDHQDKPFVYDQITIGDASQTVSPTEYFGLGQNGVFSSCHNVSFAGVSCLYNSSYFLQDKREFIFLYLFPFHFFW